MVEGGELGRNREAIQQRKVGATTPDIVILRPRSLGAEESSQFLVNSLGGADIAVYVGALEFLHLGLAK